ncbi:Protein of unknown function [Bacillus mycoides]|nr:Protein of unknown function [Bacillus mycoides]
MNPRVERRELYLWDVIVISDIAEIVIDFGMT